MPMLIAGVCFFCAAMFAIAEGVRKTHAGLGLIGVGLLVATFLVALVA